MKSHRGTVRLRSGRVVKVRRPLSSRPLLSTEERRALAAAMGKASDSQLSRSEYAAQLPIALGALSRLTAEFTFGPLSPPLSIPEQAELVGSVLADAGQSPDVRDA